MSEAAVTGGAAGPGDRRGRPIRVLISKIGLDAHDRGAKFVAQGLVSAGMEAIYLGCFHTPEAIARAAVQEGADVIGISALSGECLHYLPRLLACLKECGGGDTPVVLGGFIPQADEGRLHAAGVRGIFRPGSTMAEIVEGIRAVVEG